MDFANRHIGVNDKQIDLMVESLGFNNISDLIKQTVPASILSENNLSLPAGVSEQQILELGEKIASKNKLNLNLIGQGYYGTYTPSVIKRNILENPSWYTAYTPYQSEISQGRLEMLINFQQMVIDLTALDIANSSLLDEATAAAEAVNMAYNAHKGKRNKFVADINLHPQTLTVLKTRAEAFGTKIIIADINHTVFDDSIFAIITQPFNTNGKFINYININNLAKENNIITIGCFDLLALTLFKTAKDMNYDIAVGSAQRFGVPIGFGGPHAGFIASIDKYKRLLPGRVIGVSKDKLGDIAYRMSMQSREQHIRRDKATSNICTAQVLLAIMAVSYVIYHGKKGLRKIALDIYNLTKTTATLFQNNGYEVLSTNFFDTITIKTEYAKDIYNRALENDINLRLISANLISITVDETITIDNLQRVLILFNIKEEIVLTQHKIAESIIRKSNFLSHSIFNSYTSETKMMRYLKCLEDKDIALNHSMIALGSCTMKLNSASSMININHKGFANLHPFAPAEQTKGYQQIIQELEDYLVDITGYDKISLQPNAGSQGEFSGLLAIKKYYQQKGEDRDICLIPSSAHGTNPASAVMVGMNVVVVNCDAKGNVDMSDLIEKSHKYKQKLAAIMITYPSTHGVFEENIKEICQIIHDNGGQVYVDGANFNAMVGLSKIGEIGADVSHLNLHKTFAIPHGGGGPGIGPIGVKKHLADFLPGNPLMLNSGAVSAANYGSAGILPISWSYIKMLGKDGLEKSTKIAILNANYIAKKLSPYYKILYKNHNHLVAHECIIDLRGLKKESEITEEDIAKRLIDYGFHAPTMSFPVAGTLMIEPTESEDKDEIDRFINSMIGIYQEIQEVIQGKAEKNNNVLKNSPHIIKEVVDWQYPYSIQKAFYPLKNLESNKYFAPIKRVDNVYGDRNLFCSCPDITEFKN